MKLTPDEQRSYEQVMERLEISPEDLDTVHLCLLEGLEDADEDTFKRILIVRHMKFATVQVDPDRTLR